MPSAGAETTVCAPAGWVGGEMSAGNVDASLETAEAIATGAAGMPALAAGMMPDVAGESGFALAAASVTGAPGFIGNASASAMTGAEGLRIEAGGVTECIIASSTGLTTAILVGV